MSQPVAPPSPRGGAAHRLLPHPALLEVLIYETSPVLAALEAVQDRGLEPHRLAIGAAMAALVLVGPLIFPPFPWAFVGAAARRR